jgi:hypothetical protein
MFGLGINGYEYTNFLSLVNGFRSVLGLLSNLSSVKLLNSAIGSTLDILFPWRLSLVKLLNFSSGLKSLTRLEVRSSSISLDSFDMGLILDILLLTRTSFVSLLSPDSGLKSLIRLLLRLPRDEDLLIEAFHPRFYDRY